MLTFEASPKQEYAIGKALEWRDRGDGVLTNKYTAICFGGAIRGGKSYWAIGTAVLLCHLFPGCRIAVVRQSTEILKVNTLPVFQKIYPLNHLEQKPSQGNNWTARFHNGSEIIFWSENYDQDKELNRWRGLEVNGFILEEANELEEVTFNKSMERVGTWKMEQTWDIGIPNRVYPSFVLMTTNPAKNWIKDRFYDRHHAGTLPEGFLYIASLPGDNPKLPMDFIEQKRMVLPDYLFRKFIEGDWEVTENDRPFITEFKEMVHVADLSNEYVDQPLLVSMDFNVDPPAAIICQHGNGWINVYEEVDIGEGSIYDMCRYVYNRFGNFRLRITGDASGRAREKADKDLSNLFEIACRELRLDPRFDLDAPRSNMRIDLSRALCNAVFKGAEFGFKIKIDPRCKKLLTDIRTAQVDRFGDLIKNRRDASAFLDYLDAFRYLIATVTPDFIDLPGKYIAKKR